MIPTAVIDASLRIQPAGPRVLILPDEPEKSTASGIIIPDVAQDSKPGIGTILQLGEGELAEDGILRTIEELTGLGEIGHGDRVIYSRHAGTTIKRAGVELLLINARDIYARLR